MCCTKERQSFQDTFLQLFKNHLKFVCKYIHLRSSTNIDWDMMPTNLICMIHP